MVAKLNLSKKEEPSEAENTSQATLPELPDVKATEDGETTPLATSNEDESAVPASEEEVKVWDEFTRDEEPEEQSAGVETVEGDIEVVKTTGAPTEPTPTDETKPATDPATPTAEIPAVETPTKAEIPAEIPAVAETPVVAETAALAMTEEQRLAWRQGEVDKLVPTYKLTEEEALAINTEPETVLPRLAAELQVRVTEAVYQGLNSVLPEMLRNFNVQQTVNDQAQEAFYTANPDLNDAKFEHAVMTVGKMYREVNPKAPREEAIKAIGELARTALKLPPLQAPETDGAAVETAAATVTPIKKLKPKVFSPSRGNTAVAAKKEEGIWEEMLTEDN